MHSHRSPVDIAWTKILALNWTPQQIAKIEHYLHLPLQDTADYLEFSQLHLAVTNRLHMDIEVDLQNRNSRSRINERDKFGQQAAIEM